MPIEPQYEGDVKVKHGHRLRGVEGNFYEDGKRPLVWKCTRCGIVAKKSSNIHLRKEPCESGG